MARVRTKTNSKMLIRRRLRSIHGRDAGRVSLEYRRQIDESAAYLFTKAVGIREYGALSTLPKYSFHHLISRITELIIFFNTHRLRLFTFFHLEAIGTQELDKRDWPTRGRVLWTWSNFTDNGTTLHSRKFKSFAHEWGMNLQFCYTYTPTGNGIAEQCDHSVKHILKCASHLAGFDTRSF